MGVLLTGSWGMTLQGLNASNNGLMMAGNDRNVSLAFADIENSLTSSMFNLGQILLAADADVAYENSRQYVTAKLEKISKEMALLENADLSDRETAAVKAYLKVANQYLDLHIKPFKKLLVKGNGNGDEDFDDGTINEMVIGLENPLFDKLMALGDDFQRIQNEVSAEESDEANAAYHQIYNQSLISVLASLLLALISSVLLIRNFSRRLKYSTEKLSHIAEGNYFDWVVVDENDEIGSMLSGLKSMQIRQGYAVQLIEERAEQALQIKAALDQVTGNVMIADADYKVFYMNHAMNQMMQDVEEDFRKALPDFKADDLMGSCIDDYHANPAHQRQLLDRLKGSYTSGDLTVGNITVRVIASPVFNEDGERVATVAEWTNRTAEVAAEQGVATLVEAVQQGDLAQRISMEGKEGFFLDLSNGLNALTHTVEQGMDDIAGGLSALEAGDLTYRITNDYQGKFDELKQATNNTSNKLAGVMRNVAEAAEEVGIGSSEIAEGNNTLSSRTQEQAAALEETAASIEEITGTVQQTADNSRQANQLASDAREQAEKGGLVAEQAVKAMAEINTSSRKISDIIGVIDEIAFQTNLLALNAAVEAARAGEQGRGFAVVAGEVRTLAQRSAEAAKEIKTLINSSVESVDQGSKLVDESGAALNVIVDSVRKVGDVIAEIAAASVEETAGIDQINKAIAQLDSGTQQNTAMVEESSAASQRLNEQADDLRQQVSIFKLED